MDRMSWTTQHLIDENQMHINALRSMILGNVMDGRPCMEIQRTLSFALGILRERREVLEERARAEGIVYDTET
jgi:hypothetical protein